MIVIYHNGKNAIDVVGVSGFRSNISLSRLLIEIAAENADQVIVWCHEMYRGWLQINKIPEMFHHQKLMLSYQPGGNFFSEAIGYVDVSSFIKVNKDVFFPTWRMSSAAGAIHASVINLVASEVSHDDNFDYFLSSFAKCAMPRGLFCYSAPDLLDKAAEHYPVKADNFQLFRFVRQHYKFSWILLMLLDMIIYDRKFPIVAAIASFFTQRRSFKEGILSEITNSSTRQFTDNPTIDILIPTIGRKPYLLDFLNDLAMQTIMPRKVIIAEQNPIPGGTSELDYLDNRWPFEIKHIFSNQPGACNARNLALEHVESDWIFFADDDIRIEPSFLEEALREMRRYGNDVYNFCCLQKGQPRVYEEVHQTSIFATSSSIVSRQSLGNSKFDMAFEFGYSEDLEFGRQLIDKGFDTIYLTDPVILHLKAPFGGFRTKPSLAWDNDPIQPKPSPTVMLYKLMHHTREQLLGYRTMLMIKFYRNQNIRNPFSYLKDFRKRWNRSIYYAEKLRQDNR